MLEVLTVLLVFVLLALGATVVRSPASVEAENEELGADVPPGGGAFGRSSLKLPILVGLLTPAFLHVSLGLYFLVSIAVGLVAGVTLWLSLEALAARRMTRFEFQLADAIDLMVSSLRAGGSLTDALDGATRGTRAPLRSYFQELLDRIRVGEQPEQVLTNLERRVSLESFRLFTLTLATHWQGGGSLATTLSNVGRTIRDRVDVRRRVRSQAVETQVSVKGVLAATYGLAVLMWNSYPDRFLTFSTSEIGAMFIGLSIFLQAVGLFWVSRMSRIEV